MSSLGTHFIVEFECGFQNYMHVLYNSQGTEIERHMDADSSCFVDENTYMYSNPKGLFKKTINGQAARIADQAHVTAIGSNVLLRRGRQLALLKAPYEKEELISQKCVNLVVHDRDFIYVESDNIDDELEDQDDFYHTNVFKNGKHLYTSDDAQYYTVSFDGRYIANEFYGANSKIYDTQTNKWHDTDTEATIIPTKGGYLMNYQGEEVNMVAHDKSSFALWLYGWMPDESNTIWHINVDSYTLICNEDYFVVEKNNKYRVLDLKAFHNAYAQQHIKTTTGLEKTDG